MDVIFMPLNNTLRVADFPAGKPGVLGDLDRRFKPELGLAILSLNMNVHSRLLTREEVEAKSRLTKNGRAHIANDTR